MNYETMTTEDLILIILNKETFVRYLLRTHGPNFNVATLLSQIAEVREVLKRRDPSILPAWSPMLELLREFTLLQLIGPPRPLTTLGWDVDDETNFEFPSSMVSPFGTVEENEA